MSDSALEKQLARAKQKVQLLERMIEDSTRSLYVEQRSLRSANDFLAGVFETVFIALLVTDESKVVRSANRSAVTLLSCALSDIVGKHTGEFLEIDDLDKFFQRNNDASSRNELSEAFLLPHNGTRIPVQLSCSRLQDPEGNKVGYVIAAQDLRDQKRLESQLLQNQKLESVGELAAGIAHEINTPIQFIGDNTRFLQGALLDLEPIWGKLSELSEGTYLPQELADELRAILRAADIDYLKTEMPQAIAQSLQGVERVAKIVRAMKEFSHPGSEAKQLVNLSQLVDSTVTISTNEWKYVAEVESSFDESLPLVPCFPAEFNQVILNIVVNAAHAIGEVSDGGRTGKGKITVSTKRTGEWAEVRIRDTGGGIPENIQHKIFDPFFTTKGIGKGTGQGLAIARSIIANRHGGTIDFESTIGVGTTFVLRLPLKPQGEA